MEENILKLKLLYEQLYEISIEIGQLIDRNSYDQLPAYLDIKDNVMSELEEILKEVKLKETDLSSFEVLCAKIRDQEQANITSLTGLKDTMKKELNKANKKTKLASAYSNVETKQGNLLDYRQ